MDEDENIATAAERRDWRRCSRIMFRLLYQLATHDQRDVAREMLSTYIDIWVWKHDDELQQIPSRLLMRESKAKTRQLPEFPSENLDPADAEFENGLIEFHNGCSLFVRDRKMMHFATAILSAVTARQINKWLSNYPEEYARWKSGQIIDGPTFLDDEAAAKEAEKSWKLVETLLEHRSKSYPLENEASFYERWEATVL